MEQVATEDPQDHVGGIGLDISVGTISIIKRRIKDKEYQKKLYKKH